MKSKSIRIILVTVGALVIIGGVTFYLWTSLAQQQSKPIDKSALESGEGKAYGDLTKDELNARAQEESGHSVDELKQAELNSSLLQSFDQATAAGQALLVANEPSKSLQALEIAQAKATNQQKDADFYGIYREAADAAGDYDKGTDAVRQQIAWYKAEGATDPAASQQIAILEQRLSVREAMKL